MAAVEDYHHDGSGGYGDDVHPPAVVHIPEEFDPEDPASPANIDSPLSSPPNSPNAWDTNAVGAAGEEEGDGHNHNNLPAYPLAAGFPPDLPPLNHPGGGIQNNEGGGAGAGEPFDEDGAGNHSEEGMIGYSTKAAALSSIRDERKQRKERRRQQFMTTTDPTTIFAEEQQQQFVLQQKLQQIQQTQQREEQEEEGKWQQHQPQQLHLHDDDGLEDQPFDSVPPQITPQKPSQQPAQLTVHVVPDSPEEQPFDAAPIHQPATSRSHPMSRANETLPHELPPLTMTEPSPTTKEQQQQNVASRQQRDLDRPTSEAGASMVSNMSTSLQRRLQRYMQTSVGNNNNISSNNNTNTMNPPNDGGPNSSNGPSVVKTNATRPVSDIAASLSVGNGGTSGGGANNTTNVPSASSRHARPYSPTPGAIPPPVIARSMLEEAPVQVRSASPHHATITTTHNNSSISPVPAAVRAASPLAANQGRVPMSTTNGSAPRSSSRARERADSNNSLPFEDEIMGGAGNTPQQQHQSIQKQPPIVDLTGYRDDGTRSAGGEDIPDDERLPPHPRSLRRSNSRARGGRRPSPRIAPAPKQQLPQADMQQEPPHLHAQATKQAEKGANPPTVRDVLSFDPFAAAKSRVSSRSESQILLDPRAVENPQRNQQHQHQSFAQPMQPTQQHQHRQGRSEFRRATSLQGSSLSPRPKATKQYSHSRSSSFHNDVVQQDPSIGEYKNNNRDRGNSQKQILQKQTSSHPSSDVMMMETSNEEKKWADEEDLLPMDESPLVKQKKEISRSRSQQRQAQQPSLVGEESYPQQQQKPQAVLPRPVSPSKQHQGSTLHVSTDQETNKNTAPKSVSSPISSSFSPNFIEPKRNNSFEAPLDDDASWLARRVQLREQQQSQKRKDEDVDASWLAERVGSIDQNSLDEDASWLQGRLGGGGDGSIPKSITARRKSDAPGTAPSPKKTSGDPSITERKSKQQSKTNAKPRSASVSSKNRSSPTRTLASSEAGTSLPNKTEVKSYAPQRPASNTATNRASPVKAFLSPPPEAAPMLARTSELKSSQHRKAPSADDTSTSPIRTQQPMRRVQSDIPSTQHVMNASVPQQEYSPSLVDESDPFAAESKHASDRGFNDDMSASMASADIGSLIESIDEMVKDLEVSRVDDANSATQATSTLSSNTSEKQIPGSPTPKRAFKGKPVLVQPINNDIGVPKGDVMISLLSESTDTPWSTRIEEAIWRCRIMRQNSDTKWLKQKLERKPNTPSHGRTSVVVDVDEARVVGGIESVAASQKAALEHLKYDDLEDALALYEDIIEAYYGHFENCLKQNSTVEQLDDQVLLFNNYIGSCLHNIGLVYLLLNRYKEAYSHFERAATKRAATLGVGHTDHLASHVKAATCHIALGRQTEAVVILEECLVLSKEGARSISDQRQVAEINNNLACLYYGLGNHEKAGSYFRESFEAQTVALEHSLYAGARFSCHSATLNLAVTKANIGFMSLVSRNHEAAIEALEYSVHNQQLLLRDAHTTLIATMDHLVVAQIFAGNKDKAVRLLRRMFHMQSDAFGSTDERCLATSKKLAMLEEAEPQTFENLEETKDDYGGMDDSNNSDKKRGGLSIFKLLKSKTVKK